MTDSVAYVLQNVVFLGGKVLIMCVCSDVFLPPPMFYSIDSVTLFLPDCVCAYDRCVSTATLNHAVLHLYDVWFYFLFSAHTHTLHLLQSPPLSRAGWDEGVAQVYN